MPGLFDKLAGDIRSKNHNIIYPGLFLLAFIFLSVILSWRYFPNKPVPEGVVAKREITAPRSFEVEDTQATIEAQNEAMNAVKPVYRVDPFILNQVDGWIKSQFNLFERLQEANKANRHVEVKELKSQLPVSISDNSLHTFTNLNRKAMEQLEIMALDQVIKIMKNPIKEADEKALKEARQKARKEAAALNIPEDQANAMADLISEAIRPNARIDWDETSRQRQIKKDQVRPVMISIQKGQVIVEKGKIVTPAQLEILEAAGLQRTHFNAAAIGGIVLFVFLSIFICWVYIRQFMPVLAGSPKLLLLLIILTIFSVLSSRLLVQINPYLTMAPIASILITLLIGPRIAVLITAFITVIIGIITGDVQLAGVAYQFVTVAFITGIVSVITASRAHRRMDLVAASVVIFLVNILSVVLFSFIGSDGTRLMFENMVFAGINGFGSGLLAAGLLPLLEYFFNITTPIKLLEISNQSEPLLKRLLLEAPGTYHHSVIVGNLSEAAAEAVGEDPLLCRVGAYYHDIGKLRRPYFFIENQLGSENPHDTLSPNLSTLIILSHVKDGIEMARQNRLPEPIKDIIAQHHGTSIIAYFYHQAKQSGQDIALEEDFRYPGPKPQTKAAAIIMLADSVEAAVRTINTPNPNKIENMVRQIIKKALDDGQLDESPLSLKDLNNIARAFTRIVTGIYHQRIEYPDQIMEEIGAPVPMPSKVTHITKKQAG